MLKSKQAKNLFIDGTRTKGLDVRQGNVRAATQLANILKSSFGPQGLDKMLVTDHGEITITNDGATILKNLQVEHPAAKVLVNLARSQDHEVGDGTTSVVILAAELLKAGLSLIENERIHATNVISGYRLACDEAIRFVNDRLVVPDELTDDLLLSLIKTSMSSKILGSTADFFAGICLRAMKIIKETRGEGEDERVRYPIKSINIVKKHGRSMRESQLIEGYCLGDYHTRVSSQQMPRMVRDCRVACVDYNLAKSKLKRGIQVEITNPDELEAVKRRETSLIQQRLNLILDHDVNVILTTKAIDSLCSKMLIAKGCMGIRRVPKSDLKRVAKLTGATLITNFADLEGGESFDESYIGSAEQISVERVADDDVIFIRGLHAERTCSIVLRGANEYLLDEMHRSVHDALCAAKRVLEHKTVVPGGGAVEGALSIHLEDHARSIDTREQLAIAEFADALLVIPKTLAINAALDSTELVAKLRAFHHQGMRDRPECLRFGINLDANDVCDAVADGVVEPALVKTKIIKFATEAAITILRIDDLFRLNPKRKAQGEEHMNE